MIASELDSTLVAARQQLEAGPLWLLELWHSLTSVQQREVVETLLGERSFCRLLRALERER
jgi:hypothetical protein